MYRNNYIKETTLSNPISPFEKVPFVSFTKQINSCGADLTTMAFQAKLLSHCFSKSHSMVTPILQSEICSEMNTASITNNRLL